MTGITIADLTLEHSASLAQILSTDERLHCTLSQEQEMREVQGGEYFITCMQWAERRHGICHAILLNGQVIGSISLANIDYEGRSASAGYWLASHHWGKGYATTAFALLISRAREMGIKTLTCTIHADNAASLALWRRQGAVFSETDGKFTPVLDIGKIT